VTITIDITKLRISLEAVRTLAIMQGGHFYRCGMDLPLNVRSSEVMKVTIQHCVIPFDHRVDSKVFEELKRYEYVELHTEGPELDQWVMTQKAKQLLKELGLRDRASRPVIESICWLIENPLYGAHR